jgi:cytochrome d ubiquinol oxidase subunit I
VQDIALTLARVQFAFTMGFHIVFPALTIGLASYLCVLEALWLLGKGEVYLRLYRFWLRIFAVGFGMGVVSGVVMSYQFGTNWGPFADRTGPILGPLLSYEVLTAFFLEAGFLGVMLFGQSRVSRGFHFASTCIVATGAHISAFWILAANSWMQTPVGYGEANGQFVPLDWWQIVFNPSFPYRFVHMVLAAYLATACVVGAAGAWRHLKGDSSRTSSIMISMALWMTLATTPVQMVAGDLHGLNTLEHQPAKIAALEGHWTTERGAPLTLFGLPDMAAEETRYAVEIPHLGSLILTHDWNGEVPGLKDWPVDERPDAAIIFWSFRLMVGLGLAMLAMAVGGLGLRAVRRLYTARWFQAVMLAMAPAGLIAILAGWVTTEVGRQPYVVYGLMRTAEARSPIATPGVAGSLAAFAVVYFVVFGFGIYYVLRLIAAGPQPAQADIDGAPLGAQHP